MPADYGPMILLDKMLKRPAAASGAPVVPELELWGDAGDSERAKMPDLSVILAFVRRNAVWIAATALVVSLLCVIAVRLAFDQYSATATVLFDPRNANVTQTQEVLPDIGPDSIAIESLVQVAKSDGFLTALVEKEELSSDPEFTGSAASSADKNAAALDKLRDRLTIARRGATYVVDVSVKTADAQKSARVANAAANMIVDNESNLRSGSNQRAVDFIGGKLAQLRDRVSQDDAAIAKLKTDLKITEAGQGEVLQERRVAELNQQLVLATAHSGETHAIVDQLREANLSAGAALPAAIQSPVLSGLREDYARLTRQAAERETVFGARHPDVVAANAQLGDIRRQIAAEKDRLIASAKADYLEARKREALVADELHKAQADSGATDQDAVQLRDLERNEKSDQAVYEQLLSRQKELSEMRGLTSDDVRLVSPAIAPTRTNMPRLPVVLAGSLIIGLFAALASALARESIRRSPMAPLPAPPPLDIEASAILPVFSPAPHRDGRLAEGAAARWFAQLCAAAPIQNARRGGLILVTSAREGEGKSTVAANVAACLASEGAEVLLIQMGIGETARTHRRTGLVDVLEEDFPLEKALLWYGEASPTLLPLGGAGARGGGHLDALISGAALPSLLRRCRRQFDTLVIDGPAVEAAPALRSLAKLADAVLMIVDESRAEADRIAQAIEGFDPLKLCVVFNKASDARSASSAPVASGASLAAA
jgi:uncharacterized protein involved in exopolysaccharide biosynthesis/Mrp family chromosome partitioning ATPase